MFDSPNPTNVGGNDPAGGAETVSPITLSNDALVTFEGQKDPIKFSDYQKRQQADYTSKTQALAKEREAFQRSQQEAQRAIEQERARIQQVAAELLQRQRAGQQGNDPYASLAQKQWISGSDLAQIVRAIQEDGFGGLNKALSERDQVITALYQQLQNVQKQVQGFSSLSTTQSFENKVGQTLKSLGLDAEDLRDFAKETYLAYEGDDLDEQFPNILKQRYEQLEQHFRNKTKQRVEAAKRAPFPLPGKGGQGSAGMPKGLKGNESAKEIADMFFPSLQDE